MNTPPSQPATSPPLLSVIIPAYNESERLGPRLGQVLDYLRTHFASFELLVVDDGSTDGTAEVVRAAFGRFSSAASAGEPQARLISYQPNRGKGYAVRAGVLASRGDQVVFLDADLATPVDEIPRALALLREADLVIGSRALPGARILARPPLYRRLATAIFDLAKHVLVGLRAYGDTQCGFKAYRGHLARQLFARAQVDRFIFDVEILYLAERAGLRIREMPVRWTDQPGSKVRFWEGSINMARDLWRIRRAHRGPVVLAPETVPDPGMASDSFDGR